MTSPSLQLALAAQRIGVYLAPISTRTTAQELAHTATDSGAGMPALSATKAEALPTRDALIELWVHPMTRGEAVEGYLSWSSAAAVFTDTPLTNRVSGGDVLHSSDTAGRHKGIVRTVLGTPTATSLNKSKQ